MSSKKYILIDKEIITTGKKFDFNIFYPVGKDVKILLEKGSVVEHSHLITLHRNEAFYVQEAEQTLYADFHQSYLKNVDKNVNTFEEKSTAIYTNATNVMNKIFENPETLGNHEESKEVVNDLVLTILDDNFTMESLMNIASHDYYTHTHSLNVAVYALSLGSFIGLDKETLSILGESALLHDLGKSKVSPDIINKAGKLTDKEFETIKNHSEFGFQMAISIGITNKHILAGIRHHHEKMDGTGYPKHLKGNEIPLFARLIGLCDIFDALTSERSYKKAMSTFEALSLIKTKMNTHVDMKLLNKLIAMFKEPKVQKKD